jgi:deoxyribodipyrimidine photo-lyase
MDALTTFPATRAAALERLAHFVPKAGRSYAAMRNYDRGPGEHASVSMLSPYLRVRLVTETEVLKAVLGRHSPEAAEKFIQEVFWRTYWKGWLEQRPGVWRQYQSAVRARLDDVQTQGGLRDRWEAACSGQTDIDCFNAWAQELVGTGYLHNHARMWFASIWIFTLRLPWELGADFFLRHLLDGDPASNTLGWRWVAGVQTIGKTYQAQPDNIAKFTEGRFNPVGLLARTAEALPALPVPEPLPIAALAQPDPAKRSGFILHTEDLSPAFMLETIQPVAACKLVAPTGRSPLRIAPHIERFETDALADATTRWSERMGGTTSTAESAAEVVEWARAHRLERIITAYAPVGPVAEILRQIADLPDAPPLLRVRRTYDSLAWPHATKGFFPFKSKIPGLLKTLI